MWIDRSIGKYIDENFINERHTRTKNRLSHVFFHVNYQYILDKNELRHSS